MMMTTMMMIMTVMVMMMMMTVGQGVTLGGGAEMTNGRDFNGPERERRAFSCRRGFIVKWELEFMVQRTKSSIYK